MKRRSAAEATAETAMRRNHRPGGTSRRALSLRPLYRPSNGSSSDTPVDSLCGHNCSDTDKIGGAVAPNRKEDSGSGPGSCPGSPSSEGCRNTVRHRTEGFGQRLAKLGLRRTPPQELIRYAWLGPFPKSWHLSQASRTLDEQRHAVGPPAQGRRAKLLLLPKSSSERRSINRRAISQNRLVQ